MNDKNRAVQSLVAVGILIGGGCTPTQQDQHSELKYRGPINTFEQMTDLELLSDFDDIGPIESRMQNYLDLGDYHYNAYLNVMNDHLVQSDGDFLSPRKECIEDSPENVECAGYANIPSEAIAPYARALRLYTNVLNLFQGKRTLEESEDNLDPVAVVAGQCEGQLTNDEYSLCQTFLKASKFLERARYYRNLAVLPETATPESDGFQPRDPSKALEIAAVFHAAHEQLMNRLSDYKMRASQRLIKLRYAFDSANDVEVVPYLAAVGKAEDIQNLVSKYIDAYEAEIDQLLDFELKTLQAEQEILEGDISLNKLNTEVASIASEGEWKAVDSDIYEAEVKFIKHQSERIANQIANSKIKFSEEMRQVLGNVSTQRVLREKHLKISPQTTRIDDYWQDGNRQIVIPKNEDGTFPSIILDVIVGESQYKANAIYSSLAEQTPVEPRSDSVFSRSFGPLPDFDNPFAFPVDFESPLDNTWESVSMEQTKEVIESLCLDATSSGDLKEKINDFIPGHTGNFIANMVDYFEKFRKEYDGPVEQLVLLNPLEMGAVALDVVSNAMRALLPKTKNGIQLANELCGEWGNLPRPRIEEHVRSQVTNADGYILSTSEGRDIGLDRSQSTDESVSSGFNFFGLGVEKSVSTSVSEGSSISNSADLSSTIGFYDEFSKYPQFRHGMVVGELYCKEDLVGSVEKRLNAKPLQAVPVGSGNIIEIGTGWQSTCEESPEGDESSCSAIPTCNELALVFVVNDLDQFHEGKSVRTTRTCQGTTGGAFDQKCASNEEIKITVTQYENVEESFKSLLNLFRRAEIQNIVKDAAYSMDPQGSAFRIFQQMGRTISGVSEETIESFRPLVDQYVVWQLDEKEQKRLALESNKLSQMMAQITKFEAKNQTQLAIVENSLDLQGHQNVIRETYRQLVRGRVRVAELKSDFYLERLMTWLEIYRAAMLYHYDLDVQGDINIIRLYFAKVVKENRERLLSSSGNEPQTSLLETRDTDGFEGMDTENGQSDGVISAREALGVILDKFQNEQFESLFVEEQVTVTRLNHCYLNLDEIFLDYEQFFAREEGTSPYEIAPESARYAPTRYLTGFQQDSGTGGVSKIGYLRLPITTDPRFGNVFATGETNHGELTKDPAPALRCTNPSSINHLSKIIGMAVTMSEDEDQWITSGDLIDQLVEGQYLTLAESAALPRENVVFDNLIKLEHEEAMFGYRPSDDPENPQRIERWMGYNQMLPGLDRNGTQASLQSIPFVDEANVLNSCAQNGLVFWNTESCYQRLFQLQSCVVNSGGELFEKCSNFLNRMIGGQWYLHLPFVRDEQARDNWTWYVIRHLYKDMKLHIYFYNKELS